MVALVWFGVSSGLNTEELEGLQLLHSNEQNVELCMACMYFYLCVIIVAVLMIPVNSTYKSIHPEGEITFLYSPSR